MHLSSVMLKAGDLTEFLAVVNFDSNNNNPLHSLRSETNKKKN